ncbi:PREDICTED: ribonuclease P protein subunit p25-like protein [Polistes dominula]|uniref:Ribonuclease P protein subunit p25-like protein n=1 Tax=Polistes dominula TaxID=743375 RepID=A0ABM1IAC9_POLDO|nr:PREDICTED: ribonuclease P protein subunit p25-like protein [Polistes dominula]XP_015177166.1 PREDICTED: ribonuclease P protein subunit p25-like protein [Polistes dominula]
MGRSKRRRNAEISQRLNEDKNYVENKDLPFTKLNDKYILMHVNSGTKKENVLRYALEEFPKFTNIIWHGVGQAVYKVISCIEIFKVKYPGLHQINKLRYVLSNNKNGGDRFVPEIHILLSKEAQDTTELGYQAPGDTGQFNLQGNTNSTEPNITDLDVDKSNTLEDDNNSSAIDIDSETSTTTESKFTKKRPNKNPLLNQTTKKKKQ